MSSFLASACQTHQTGGRRSGPTEDPAPSLWRKGPHSGDTWLPWALGSAVAAEEAESGKAADAQTDLRSGLNPSPGTRGAMESSPALWRIVSTRERRASSTTPISRPSSQPSCTRLDWLVYRIYWQQMNWLYQNICSREVDEGILWIKYVLGRVKMTPWGNVNWDRMKQWNLTTRELTMRRYLNEGWLERVCQVLPFFLQSKTVLLRQRGRRLEEDDQRQTSEGKSVVLLQIW